MWCWHRTDQDKRHQTRRGLVLLLLQRPDDVREHRSQLQAPGKLPRRNIRNIPKALDVGEPCLGLAWLPCAALRTLHLIILIGLAKLLLAVAAAAGERSTWCNPYTTFCVYYCC